MGDIKGDGNYRFQAFLAENFWVADVVGVAGLARGVTGACSSTPSCVPRKRLLGEFRSTFQSTSAYHCPSVCLGLNNHLILLKRKVTQISLFRMGSVGTNMEALEMRIKELELENMTLKSQLDKYQTIFNLQGETVGKQVWFRFHLSLDVKISS